MSSKLIVKNLPKSASEESIRKAFEVYSTVTDLKLKKNAEGESRGFAFVGLNSPEDAEMCMKKLNRSFIKGSRVTVELARKATERNPNEIKSTESTDISNANEQTKTTDLNFLGSKMTSVDKVGEPSLYKVRITRFPKSWNKTKFLKFMGSDFKCSTCHMFKQRDVPKFLVTTESWDSLQLLLQKNGTEVEDENTKLKVVQINENAGLESCSEQKQETQKLNESDEIMDTGRLFVRNLSYTVTEEELEDIFRKYGEVVESSIPIDYVSHRSKGFGYVTFLLPEHALKAYASMNGTSLKGRTVHIMPAKEAPTKPKAEVADKEFKTTYQKKKQEEMKSTSTKSYNWNSLFIGANTVADSLSNRYGVRKQEILTASGKGESLPVRIALGETKLVNETKQFLIDHGVNLDAFNQKTVKRSKTVILAKNLPVGTSKEELETLFTKNAPIDRLVMPPTGLSALVTFKTQNDAKRAFVNLAYTKFKGSILYLEWAPTDCFVETSSKSCRSTTNMPAGDSSNSKEINGKDFLELEPKNVPESANEENNSNQNQAITEDNACVFVKNLSFETDEQKMKQAFSKFESKIESVFLARYQKGGRDLSRGYGFVQFKNHDAAMEAIKLMQGTKIDGHEVELMLSRKPSNHVAPHSRSMHEQTSSATNVDEETNASCKILVKNVPFEVTKNELHKLFATFGQVKFIRLPQKQAGNGHRGFCFVEYHSLAEAKKAFVSLSQSTHLLGRRLVLQWAEDADSVADMRKRTADKLSLQQKAEWEKAKKAKIEDQM